MNIFLQELLYNYNAHSWMAWFPFIHLNVSNQFFKNMLFSKNTDKWYVYNLYRKHYLNCYEKVFNAHMYILRMRIFWREKRGEEWKVDFTVLTQTWQYPAVWWTLKPRCRGVLKYSPECWIAKIDKHIKVLKIKTLFKLTRKGRFYGISKRI